MADHNLGDTVEISTEGLHGWPVGKQVLITQVDVPQITGDTPVYKVDSNDSGRKRSRYVSENEIRAIS